MDFPLRKEDLPILHLNCVVVKGKIQFGWPGVLAPILIGYCTKELPVLNIKDSYCRSGFIGKCIILFIARILYLLSGCGMSLIPNIMYSFHYALWLDVLMVYLQFFFQNSERELWQKIQREVCLECCEVCFISFFFYIFSRD
jgi:hypothetical protein